MFARRSSRRLAVATCLGLVMALAFVDTSLAQQPSTPVLRLALFDTVGLPAEVADKTRQRVIDIFEQIGVVIEWYEPSSVSNPGDAKAPYYLKVILTTKEASAMGQPADAMGFAYQADRLPDTVWLFDPVIRRALAGSARRPRPLSSHELGRAYAKVLCHEVIHAVTNSPRHADSGVMAPTQNRKVLLSSGAAVDEVSSKAFRRGLARIELLLVAGG